VNNITSKNDFKKRDETGPESYPVARFVVLKLLVLLSNTKVIICFISDIFNEHFFQTSQEDEQQLNLYLLRRYIDDRRSMFLRRNSLML
jgi:hypothetical protein